MKMIILAGGTKSAISEGSEDVPKPLLQIGGKPLLWHIMKHAALYGIREFIICGGYKIEAIKDYFLDFYIYQSDILVDTGENTVKILDRHTENWSVEIVDTGIKAMPTERVEQVLTLAGDTFFVTYGDCLSDVSLNDMRAFHEKEGKEITVAVAKPTGRKTPLHFLDRQHSKWESGDNFWTSAGIFLMQRNAFADDNWRRGDLEDILIGRSVAAYRHGGFFSTIETLRDKSNAEAMWSKGIAPWVDTL